MSDPIRCGCAGAGPHDVEAEGIEFALLDDGEWKRLVDHAYRWVDRGRSCCLCQLLASLAIARPGGKTGIALPPSALVGGRRYPLSEIVGHLKGAVHG